jgi:hypothetical protein
MKKGDLLVAGLTGLLCLSVTIVSAESDCGVPARTMRA